jgi:hypothetical protein
LNPVIAGDGLEVAGELEKLLAIGPLEPGRDAAEGGSLFTKVLGIGAAVGHPPTV